MNNKIFKINDFITLKLEKKRTNIYVKGLLFHQCMHLFLQFDKNKVLSKDSIDELSDQLYSSEYLDSIQISPEEEFMGHCSNLQAWFENDYDTRLLHSNISFPLLKILTELGDSVARKVFKLEIGMRISSNFLPTIEFLYNERYFSFLNYEEVESLIDIHSIIFKKEMSEKNLRILIILYFALRDNIFELGTFYEKDSLNTEQRICERFPNIDRNELKKWKNFYFLSKFPIEDDNDDLKVKDMKGYLEFKDDNMSLVVWLDIKGQGGSLHGVIYDIKDLFGEYISIESSIDELETIFKYAKISEIFKKRGLKGCNRNNRNDWNELGETFYLRDEYEEIKTGIKEILSITSQNESENVLGVFDSNLLDRVFYDLIIAWKNQREKEISDNINKATEIVDELNNRFNFKDIKKNIYLKLKTVKLDINSNCPFVITNDDRYILYGTIDNSIKMVDLFSTKIIKEFKNHINKIEDIFLSYDNKYIGSCDKSGIINIWELESRKLIKNFKGSFTRINCVYISHDNKYIISGSEDYHLKIWDFKSEELLFDLRHENSVKYIEQIPNSNYIASCSWDKTVRIWDLITGKSIYIFNNH